MSLNKQEPKPVKNNYKPVANKLIDMLQERKELGLKKYGTYLQPFNSRKVAVDLLQELVDASQYTVQLLDEFDFYYRLLDATSEYLLTGNTDKLEAIRLEVLKIYKLMQKTLEEYNAE